MMLILKMLQNDGVLQTSDISLLLNGGAGQNFCSKLAGVFERCTPRLISLSKTLQVVPMTIR